MFNQKRQLDLTTEEGMKELIKEMNMPKPPKGNARTLAFIMRNQDQELLAHIVIPPPHTDIEELTLKDYQIKEVMLRRPTVDITNMMITASMKEVFQHMDKDESKLIMV